jgi:hypothetical protein
VLGEDVAGAQLCLANRLWNTLVAIDRARVERYRRIMHDAAQERIAAIKAEMAELREAIQIGRKTARSRAVDLGDMPVRLQALRVEIGAWS